MYRWCYITYNVLVRREFHLNKNNVINGNLGAIKYSLQGYMFIASKVLAVLDRDTHHGKSMVYVLCTWYMCFPSRITFI